MKLKPPSNDLPLVNPPFFYGWIIVFVAGLSVFFSGPGQTYSISIFIDHYIADFDYSRSYVSGIYSTATLCAGFTLFLVGRLVDRFGQRAMMAVVASMLAVACFWNALLTGAIMMFIGIFLLRLFGQGSMTLLPNTLVPQWFRAKRGRALSLMTIGGFASPALFPPLNTWLIDQMGWRAAWVFWGILLVAVFVPLAILFVRNQPKDIGEVPDGDNRKARQRHWSFMDAARTKVFWIVLAGLLLIISVWLINRYSWMSAITLWAVIVLVITPAVSLFVRYLNKKRDDRSSPVNPNIEENEVNWTLKEAMRTRTFWFILFAVSVPALVNTGVTFHIVSIADGKGLSPETAALILSLMAIFGFPVSFIVGYLVDRISVHYILAVTFLGHIISLVILLFTNSAVMAIIFGVMWGIVNGFERITLSIVWPNYFGREHLGSIKGLAQTCMVVSSAFGPLPFGLFYDWFGGYQEILLVMLLLPVTAGILALFAPQPTYPD
ncbi:MFS transporter [Sediminibacillus albus]|uniref:Major Facilitator Superfamily protein n=1 Tax=Sediminibacillus albus TaxID=407036 RepID=A0A1G9AU90_9BACI|nr:MFS transporter [Sediminibacillus albus]SDK30896.1 Major Facilitator Superfamily protein [Sediminibacillus albus]